MNAEERKKPSLAVDPNRRRRIADGAGVSPSSVDEVVNAYSRQRQVMLDMAGMNVRERMRYIRERR